MKLIPLPAFTDNYIWMLHDGQHALVVDPGDASPVLDALQHEGVQLQTILVTHHHADHTGGIEALSAVSGATVWGPAGEPVPDPYQPLAGGDAVTALGLRFEVIDVGGHTRHHIAYFAQPAGQEPLVFCGDALFSGGCGRIFEGTAAQMEASLRRLAALPAATRVCCAHEYTLSNLRFAVAAEPDNTELQHYQAHCQALRARGEPTLPSSMGRERAINPFLRSDQATVAAAAQTHEPAIAAAQGPFAALRAWKDRFR